MIQRLLLSTFIFVFAAAVLLTSVFRTASPRYSFKLPPSPPPTSSSAIPEIKYQLPDPGKIQPGHPLWPLEVIRDKAWLYTNPNPIKKAQISLLLADKRLASAQALLLQNKIDLAVSTVVKAELYLSQSFDQALLATQQGMETSEFMFQLSLAALKHREVLETIRAQSPEDAQPIINEILDHPKQVYEKTCHQLHECGATPPENPFK